MRIHTSPHPVHHQNSDKHHHLTSHAWQQEVTRSSCHLSRSPTQTSPWDHQHGPHQSLLQLCTSLHPSWLHPPHPHPPSLTHRDSPPGSLQACHPLQSTLLLEAHVVLEKHRSNHGTVCRKIYEKLSHVADRGANQNSHLRNLLVRMRYSLTHVQTAQNLGWLDFSAFRWCKSDVRSVETLL